MAPIPEVVRNALGDHITAFTCNVADKTYSGWAAPAVKLQRNDGFVADRGTNCWVQNIRLFCGDGGRQLYAVPGLRPPDVALAFRVGSHNAGSVDQEEKSVRKVHQFLADVYANNPFDVTGADAAGFGAKFLKSVTSRDAESIVRSLVCEIAPESFDLFSRILANAGLPLPTRRQKLAFGPRAGETIEAPDELAAACACIERLGLLRLWWD